MSKRINIMLPEKTLAVLDRVASKGNRSGVVSAAVIHYVETRGQQTLREQLKAGYQANADESLKIAADWFPLEEQAWQKSQPAPRVKRKKQPTFAVARSISARSTRPSAERSRRLVL